MEVAEVGGAAEREGAEEMEREGLVVELEEEGREGVGAAVTAPANTR